MGIENPAHPLNPIHHMNYHGGGNPNIMVGLWIAMNIIMGIIYLVFIFIGLRTSSRNYKEFFEYFLSGLEVLHICFISVNGIALICWMAAYIASNFLA